MKWNDYFNLFLFLLLSVFLFACASDDPSDDNKPKPTEYTLGGNVTGLVTATNVTLTNTVNNDSTTAEALEISSPGPFTFKTSLVTNDEYVVTVTTQPTGQECTVANGANTVNGANIDNIMVECSDTSTTPPLTYQVGGSVTGLTTGTSVELTNVINKDSVTAEVITVADSSPTFTFTKSLVDTDEYEVTVSKHPDGLVCNVTNGNDTIKSANVDNILVECGAPPPPMYSLGGNVTGMADGTSLELTNNIKKNDGTTDVDTLPVTGNADFTFTKTLATNDEYDVSISKFPAGQNCSVSNGKNTMGSFNISDVTVVCAPKTPGVYSISGTVNGFLSDDSLVIQIGDAGIPNMATQTVNATNTSYTFDQLTDKTNYTLTIVAPLPADHLCSFGGDNTINVFVNGADVPGKDIICRKPLSKLAFTDANLASCVSGQAMLYVDDLLVLNCKGKQISDLTGIEQLIYLTELHFADNAISTVTPLTILTQLEKLDLSNNNISDDDITDLSAISALSVLNLENLSTGTNNNTLTRIDFNSTSLTELNANANQVSSFLINTVSALTDLANLQQLHLSGNTITAIDTDLSLLPKLTHLDLSLNQISDVTPLKTVVNIKELRLNDNNINEPVVTGNVNALETLTNATLIDLNNNPKILCSELQGLITSLNTQQSVVTPTTAQHSINCNDPGAGPGYEVSGTINWNGNPSDGLILRLNGTVELPVISTMTEFVFGTTTVPNGSDYIVTVFKQPQHPSVDIFCSVINGSGNSTSASSVNIICKTDPEIADIVTFNEEQGNLSNIYNLCIKNLRQVKSGDVLTAGQIGVQVGTPGVDERFVLQCVGSAQSKIDDLYGVQFLKKITTLKLDHNAITDFSLITKLIQLKSLSLYSNKITTIPSFIVNMVNLGVLNLGSDILSDSAIVYNQIDNVSILANMPFPDPSPDGTQGPKLLLQNNLIVDVQPLSTITTLNSLNLLKNKIHLNASGNLRSLVELKNSITSNGKLNLTDNPIIPCSDLIFLYDEYLAANNGVNVITSLLDSPQYCERRPGEAEDLNAACTRYDPIPINPNYCNKIL